MNIDAVCKYLEEIFPLSNAMEYDNPGLLTWDRNTEVKGILLTLDCTSDAIDLALKSGCNMIIAHHPLIFGGIDSVSCDTSTGRLLTRLIKNDIALYGCHTQLDCTDEFGNLEIAACLGASDAKPLEGATIGVVFTLPSPVSLGEYASKVRKDLNASGVITIAPHDSKVTKVFVQGGAFDEENMKCIIDSGVDLVISGEIKHHHMLELFENGVMSVAAGHNATERVYLPKLKNVLEKEFGGMPIFVDFGKETALV